MSTYNDPFTFGSTRKPVFIRGAAQVSEVQIRRSTTTTPPVFLISDTPLAVNPELSAWLQEEGHTDPVRAERIAKLAGRPIHLIKSRRGIVGLLFGPVGAAPNATVTRSNTDVTPTMEAFLRPTTLEHVNRLRSIAPGVMDGSNSIPNGAWLDMVGWNFAQKLEWLSPAVSVASYPPDVWAADKQAKYVAHMGDLMTFTEAFHLFRTHRNNYGNNFDRVFAIPAAGAFGPGYTHLGDALVQNPFHHKTVSSLGAVGTMSSGGIFGGLSAFTTDTRVLFKPQWYDGGAYTSGVVQTYKDGLLTSWTTHAATLGLKVPVVASLPPFVVMSSVIGYAYGLDTEASSIAMDILSIDVGSLDSGLVRTLTLDVAEVEVIHGASAYKRMFPSQQISGTHAAYASSIDSMPEWLKFRTRWRPDGFTFGTISADETTLAVDVARAGSSLDEIQIQSPDEGAPDTTYGALVGSTYRRIQTKKNAVVVVPMAASETALASLNTITYQKLEGDTPVATQDGLEIDPAEAMLAVRVGAPVSFHATTTPTEVALKLYGLPTWEDVLAVSAESSEASEYVIDPSMTTTDGSGWLVSDDAWARGLPMLLGQDQSVYGGLALGTAFGTGKIRPYA